MNEVNVVTIPLDEYIELRRKADEGIFIATELGRLEQRIVNCEEKIYHIGVKMEG